MGRALDPCTQRELDIAPAEVPADARELECLVAGQALIDDSQQGLADLHLDGCGRLLRGGERPEPAPGEAGALRNSRPTYRTDRASFVGPGDQPVDVRS